MSKPRSLLRKERAWNSAVMSFASKTRIGVVQAITWQNSTISGAADSRKMKEREQNNACRAMQ